MRARGALLALALGGCAPRDVAELPGAAGLDAWLAAAEARYDDLKPGTERRIVWAGAPGARTPLSLVYVHGFSATSEEIRPLPDDLAAAFGANLHYARLTGHGRDMQTGGAAMAEGDVASWMARTREAAAIGALIGERTVLIGTSTGGTLIALAAAEGGLPEAVAGVALLAPNFRIAEPRARYLALPGAGLLLRIVLGPEGGFEPVSPGHAEWWTTRYPIRAVLPAAEVARAVEAADHGAARVPALMLYAPGDTVVDHAVTRAVAAAWGGPVALREVTLAPGDDPARHVVAGEILSPGATPAVTAAVRDWIAALPGVEAAARMD